MSTCKIFAIRVYYNCYKISINQMQRQLCDIDTTVSSYIHNQPFEGKRNADLAQDEIEFDTPALGDCRRLAFTATVSHRTVSVFSVFLNALHFACLLLHPPRRPLYFLLVSLFVHQKNIFKSFSCS